jgi:hypothetical protein
MHLKAPPLIEVQSKNTYQPLAGVVSPPFFAKKTHLGSSLTWPNFESTATQQSIVELRIYQEWNSQPSLELPSAPQSVNQLEVYGSWWNRARYAEKVRIGMPSQVGSSANFPAKEERWS